MLLFSIAIARNLGLEHYAAYTYVFAFINPTLRTLCDAGFDINLVRELQSNENPRFFTLFAQKSKALIWLITLPIAFGLYLAGGVGLHLYYGFFGSALLLINLFSDSYIAVFRAFSNAGYISKINSKITLTEYLCAFAIILVFKNLFFALVAIVIFDILKLLVSRKSALSNHIGNLEISSESCRSVTIKSIFSHLKQNNIKVLVYNFLDTFYFRMSISLLTWYSPVAELTNFTTAQRFITALRVLPGSILYVLTPEFSKNKDKMQYAPFVLLAFILSATLFFTSDFLIEITYSYRFKDAIPVLKVLSIFFFFFFIRFIFEARIFAFKKEKILITSSIISISIFLITLKTLNFSAINASYSLLLSELVLFVILLIYNMRLKTK